MKASPIQSTFGCMLVVVVDGDVDCPKSNKQELNPMRVYDRFVGSTSTTRHAQTQPNLGRTDTKSK